MNLKHNTFYKCVRNKLKEYQEFIEGQNEKDGLCIMHHRKASIGAITMNNCHPFNGTKFLLMQNGTSKAFMKEHGDTYKKESDSETLLYYLEDKADTLEEAIEELDKITDKLGIIILIDPKKHKVLIYADGARESWIKLQNGLVKEYSNYEPNIQSGFKNIGYILMDFEGKVLEKRFEKELNTTSFIETYSYSYTGGSDYTSYGGYDHSSYYGHGVSTYNRNQLSLASVTSELNDSDLNQGTITVLANNEISTYTKLLALTEAELCLLEGMTTAILNEIKEEVASWGMSLSHDENDYIIEEFRKELESNDAALAAKREAEDDEDLHKRMEKLEDKEIEDKEIEDDKVHVVEMGIRNGEFFYSEDILNDDMLLGSDMLCYIYRSDKPSIKGYAYQNMGIPEEIAIKRVVGKSMYKHMKTIYNRALEEACKNFKC